MAAESALSVARALFDEPGLRHDLRRRPLPEDVGHVLALIGSEGRQLEQAATELGANPRELQQAARFYVQEILLFPGADDYRLLGVAPGADTNTLKRHYRMLQSWLHPDRADAGTDRTVHAARINSAYRYLRHLPPTETARDRELATLDSRLRTQHWLRVEDEPVNRTGRNLALSGLALVMLGGGLWLAWRWQQVARDTPAWAYEPEPAPDRTPAKPAATGFAQALAHPDPTDDASLRPAPPESGSAPPAAEATATDSTDPETVAGTPLADVETQATASPPSGPIEADASRGDAVVQALVASRSTAVAPAVAPSTPAERPIGPAPTSKTLPTATAQDPDVPAQAAIAALSDMDAIQRDRAVQQRAHALLSFLTRRQTLPPPIWRSGHALDAAEAIRRDLGAGAGGRNRPQVVFDQVRWEIEAEQVSLQAPITPADRGAPRMLHARFRWHDQNWWVESVTLEGAEDAAGR